MNRMSGTNEFKRVTAFVLAAVLAVCGMMLSDARSAYAGAKKPGKPVAKASLYSGNVIIVKWKKVKNAKSYQIYRKIASGKWKKIKTIKAGKKKSFRYEAYAKANRRYYYKVRGVNGTKNGSFSKVTSVYFKAFEPLYKAGGTYDIEMPDGAKFEGVKIKETEVFDGGRRIMYVGSKDGREVFITTIDDGRTFNRVEWGDYCKDGDNYYPDGKDEDGTQHAWTFGKSGEGFAWCHGAGAWEEGIKLYYTFDGTEPKVGQEDKFGDESGFHIQPYAAKVQVRGTVSYGDGLVIIGDNPVEWFANYGNNHWSLWVKVYKDDKLIGVWYTYEPDR